MSWNSAFELDNYLDNFKSCIADTQYLSLIESEIENSQYSTSYIENVYKYVQKRIKYAYVDLHLDGYLPNTIKHIYEQRKADCKDYSTLMHKLFRKKSYEAYMVDLLTYDDSYTEFNSRDFYLYQFNHAILYVNTGNHEYYLDATGGIHNTKDIRSDVEGLNALLVNDLTDSIDLINIPHIKSDENKIDITFNGEIRNDSLFGTINFKYTGHSSLEYRHFYNQNKNELLTYIKRQTKTIDDKISVLNIDISGITDVFKDTVNFSIDIHIPSFIQDISGIRAHRLNFLEKINDPFFKKQLSGNKTRLPLANFSKYVNYNIKYPNFFNSSYLPKALIVKDQFFNINMKSTFIKNKLLIQNSVIQLKRDIDSKNYKQVKANYQKLRNHLSEYITF